jgi:RHS repeat-associated protein
MRASTLHIPKPECGLLYYPFGSSKIGWKNEEFSYAYDFNGKETDNETGLQDYGFRIYNKSYGKFLSVDPLAPDYPWYTPYQFAGNTPIASADLDGLEPDLKNTMLQSESYFKRQYSNHGNINSKMSNEQKVKELKKRVGSYDGFYVAFDKSTGKTTMQKVETIIKKVDAEGLKVEYENRLTTYYLDENGDVDSEKTTFTSQDKVIEVNKVETKEGKRFEEIGVPKSEGKQKDVFLGANKFNDDDGFVSTFSDFVKNNNSLLMGETITQKQNLEKKQLGSIVGYFTRGLKMPGVAGKALDNILKNIKSGYVKAHIKPSELTSQINWMKHKSDTEKGKESE